MTKLKCENNTPLLGKMLILKEYGELEYITIINIPILVIGDPYAPIQIRTHSKINEAVTKAILKRDLLVRGKELRFFRQNTLQLSLEKFARELNVTLVTIFKWEKDKNKPLHPINELAVRTLLAEKLNLRIRLRLRRMEVTSIATPTPKIKINAGKLVKFNEIERPLDTDLLKNFWHKS